MRNATRLIDRWLHHDIRRFSSTSESITSKSWPRVSNTREREEAIYATSVALRAAKWGHFTPLMYSLCGASPFSTSRYVNGTIEGEFSAPSSSSSGLHESLSLFLSFSLLSPSHLPLTTVWIHGVVRTTPDSNEVSNLSSQTTVPSVPRSRQTLCLFEMISMHRQPRWNDSRAGMA